MLSPISATMTGTPAAAREPAEVSWRQVGWGDRASQADRANRLAETVDGHFKDRKSVILGVWAAPGAP